MLIKIHRLGYYAVLVGENTCQLFSDYEPFTNSKRCHASEDLESSNYMLLYCCNFEPTEYYALRIGC
jgi:hypothetical protein